MYWKYNIGKLGFLLDSKEEKKKKERMWNQNYKVKQESIEPAQSSRDKTGKIKIQNRL